MFNLQLALHPCRIYDFNNCSRNLFSKANELQAVTRKSNQLHVICLLHYHG